MMSRSRKLAGFSAAVLIGVSSVAFGQAGSLGAPPVGLTEWTVFSCMFPEQAPVCTVPIQVRHEGGNKCLFKVAQFIEFDSSRTRRIRWALQNADATENREFRFGHTETATRPSREGIEFTLDVNSDFESDNSSNSGMFVKKLRRNGALPRAILFYYDINVEWLDPPRNEPTACDSHGPAIINRGR
jgi:hypothetical protein